MKLSRYLRLAKKIRSNTFFLRLFLFLFMCLAVAGHVAGQIPLKDFEQRDYLNQMPKEARSDPEVIAALERLRHLKASQSRLGKKHPSFANLEKQLSEAQARLEALSKKYRTESKDNTSPDMREGQISDPERPILPGEDRVAAEIPYTRDPMARLQQSAMQLRQADWGYWGSNPGTYTNSVDHSNRLVPVYTFGGNLSRYKGARSIYRDSDRLKKLYGRMPEDTLNLEADYFDLTDLFDLQKRAIENEDKKFIFLVVFDGLDYDTLRAAAVYKSGEVAYDQGRGVGLIFQDYAGCETDFGFAATSPYCREIDTDVNSQILLGEPARFGGYDSKFGGATPWDSPRDMDYLLGKNRQVVHAVTDSASAACSMVTGRKLVNSTLNISPDGKELDTIARWAQKEKGFAIGVVTSVPFCHATPAAAYAVNVSRDDYQDLARDMLGLPSISHRSKPLPGLDVVIGGGAVDESASESAQGLNYVPGNRYICESDLDQISTENYVVARRQRGKNGKEILDTAVLESIERRKRLLGLFGVKNGHLPFQTSDGDYAPVAGSYSREDVAENPTLSDFTQAAIRRLHVQESGFWLMVEAGDVDFAAHENDMDRLIGAVMQGEKAVESIFNWIEANNTWHQSLVIIASDHGHSFHLTDPNSIAKAGALKRDK
jgi:alkaline phosphatase